MRASRLVSVLLLLQTRGRLTAHELASSLEVSERTIYRDIVSLQAAGVPVYGDTGPAGGYRLLDGYQTRLTGLTTAEAQALFLAGPPAAVAELGLWDSYLAEFRARLYQGEATVRLSRHGRERLYTQTSPEVIRAIEASAGPPDEHGWVTAVVPAESLPHARGEFLRLGAEVEVLAPHALRELMRDTAHSLVELYRM
jgi:predicted DNA-binding transcriptional regulator YafY